MADVRRKAGVIGWPVKHSRSPLIHGTWLHNLGIDGAYTHLPIAPEAIENLKHLLLAGGYCGANVTIPHKEAAYRLADHVEPEAERLGAANTLWFEGDDLFATNTDGYGFLANLDAGAPSWDKAGGAAVVLGAGGASRAIIGALLDRGFDPVIVLNRTEEKAAALATVFGPRLRPGSLSDAEENLKNASLLVNTTSVGMGGNGRFDFALGGLKPGAVVTDIVYTPLRTDLLDQAERQGFRSVDGLGMLLHQAVPGFQKWFGTRPDVTPELRQRLLDDLGEHE